MEKLYRFKLIHSANALCFWEESNEQSRYS